VVQVGYLPSPPTQLIATKIGMGCPVADVINHAKFQLDRFRGFRAPDGRKSLSPIDLRHHPYNSYALPCYTVIVTRRLLVKGVFDVSQSNQTILSAKDCGCCRSNQIWPKNKRNHTQNGDNFSCCGVGRHRHRIWNF